ncbi:MAG TPA: hypothetical protein VFE47_28265 [Tepidisphaeraceae bacterium]|jgi:hypothetical protein|nr:hypothetical protein [Tepidisphaeraceae bacterium]
MSRHTLTREQAVRLHKLIGFPLRWANRVVDRMNMLGFTPDDPVFRSAMRARDALQEFAVATHYASCSTGVGKSHAET